MGNELNVTKNFGLLVTLSNGKQMKKECDTIEEIKEIVETIRQKAPDADIKIIKKEEKLRGFKGRKNSIAFEPVYDYRVKDWYKDSEGNIVYHSKEVPKKQGLLFCTECHEYRKFIPADWNNRTKVCHECGISDNDYHVKKANGLWEKRR